MSRIDDFLEMLDSYEGREPAIDTSFNIREFDDFYRISGIKYLGQVVSYDLAKERLPEENLEESVERALNAGDTDFRAASAPLIYAICKALYKNKDCLKDVIVGKAGKDISRMISNTAYSITLSKGIYSTTGEGEIIHDYKQATQYSRPANFVGETGFITNASIQPEDYTRAVLGTDDSMQEIADVFKWVTGNNAFIYRLSINPSEKGEYVVVFGASGSRFCLNGGGINGVWPALGVRPAQSSAKKDKPEQEKEIPFRGAAAAA